MRSPTSSDGLRRLPLYAGLCAALALFSAPLPALAIDVMNCGDEGAGTLREAITNAAPGETIDLSHLPSKPECATVGSVITLSHGEIVIAQKDLTLQGPSERSVTIKVSAGSGSRVLNHTGNGLLVVDHLVISDGELAVGPNETGYGGCIQSRGSVFLAHSAVTNYTATAGWASGGGIYAESVALLDSIVSGNRALLADGGMGGALGGGVFVHKALSVLSSTVSGNEATNGGGGVWTSSQMPGIYTTIAYSTFDGNKAAHCGAGYLLTTSGVTVLNSTISEIPRRSPRAGSAWPVRSMSQTARSPSTRPGRQRWHRSIQRQPDPAKLDPGPQHLFGFVCGRIRRSVRLRQRDLSANANVPGGIISVSADPKLALCNRTAA